MSFIPIGDTKQILINIYTYNRITSFIQYLLSARLWPLQNEMHAYSSEAYNLKRRNSEKWMDFILHDSKSATEN
jgi:hypothetical protein